MKRFCKITKPFKNLLCKLENIKKITEVKIYRRKVE